MFDTGIPPKRKTILDKHILHVSFNVCNSNMFKSIFGNWGGNRINKVLRNCLAMAYCHILSLFVLISSLKLSRQHFCILYFLYVCPICPYYSISRILSIQSLLLMESILEPLGWGANALFGIATISTGVKCCPGAISILSTLFILSVYPFYL